MPFPERGRPASAPLRVALDLSPAVQGHGGIGRYARELGCALLAEADPGLALETFVVDALGRPLEDPLARLPGRRLSWRNKTWRARVAIETLLGGKLDALLGAPDVFHGTDHTLPPLRRSAGVLTIHDLSYLHLPNTATALNRAYQRTFLPRFAARADAIVTDSEWTRRDVLDAFRVDPARVTTAPLGVSSRYGPRSAVECDDVRARYNLPRRYLLSVGTLEPRKNLGTLLAAFEAAAVPELGLVIVGPSGWHLAEAWRVQGRDPSPRTLAAVVRPGFVPEADLPALYAGAEAFCFPSLYEGFGLPALEAMACGASVLASDRSSLPEVVGEAGWLLPPTDIEAWADAIRRIATDEALRVRLGTAGRARAALFPWSRTAAITWQAYEEAHARRT